MSTASASAERRARLAMVAAQSARGNRPAALIVVTVAACAAAMVYLAWAAFTLRAADRALSRERMIAAETVQLAGELVTLRSRASSEGDAGGQPITQIRSRIQALAGEAGVTGRVPVPTDRFDTLGKSVRRRFEFTNVTDESLPALLEWVNRAVAEIPGLEVYSISVRPAPNNWVMNVSFSRWEKPG